MPASHSPNEVAVLIKALDVLDVIAIEGPCRATTICAKTGITKPATYRILNTLEQKGYVVRNEAERTYSLGPTLYGISRAAQNSSSLLPLAYPIMQRLNEVLAETINLATLHQCDIIYLASIESPQRLRTTTQFALRDKVYATALGKCMLAAMTEKDANAILTKVGLQPVTPRTIISLADLQTDLRIAHKLGYAIDDEENELGTRCIAAAVLNGEGSPIAALSASAPTARFPDNSIEKVGELVHHAAREITQLIN